MHHRRCRQDHLLRHRFAQRLGLRDTDAAAVLPAAKAVLPAEGLLLPAEGLLPSQAASRQLHMQMYLQMRVQITRVHRKAALPCWSGRFFIVLGCVTYTSP